MRLLIVDDDPTTAELTAECLMMDQSMAVRTAGDGVSALRVSREFAPDVILLDVELPDASGLELVPQFKDAGQGRTRIIIFSGTAPQFDSAPLPYAVDAWITKPASLDELLECISQPATCKNPPS